MARLQPTAAAFMTHEPCVVDKRLTLADAADRMRSSGIRHLLVVDEGRLVGVVARTDLDFEAALAGRNADRTTIDVAMQPALLCSLGHHIAEVALQMEASHRDAAVIVDEQGHVAGIFTITDALRALRELAVGQPVAPGIRPLLRIPLRPDREHVPFGAHARGVVRSQGAAPTTNDGATSDEAFP